MSITIIPQEQCEADYYLQDMSDGALRLAYEVIQFCERVDNVRILIERDVVDLRLFLSEPLPKLIECREVLTRIRSIDIAPALEDIYTDLLKCHAMYEIANVAKDIYTRINEINKKPWNTDSLYGSAIAEPISVRNSYGRIELDAYSKCRSYVSLIKQCINIFRDIKPDFVYIEMLVQYFEEHLDSVEWYNKEKYTEHREADAAKYKSIRDELMPLFETGIKCMEVKDVKKSDYETNEGQYVLCCNEYSRNEGGGDNWRDYVDYFSPIEVADTEEKAHKRLRELKRLIYIYSTDRYYTRIGICERITDEEDGNRYSNERFTRVYCDDD